MTRVAISIRTLLITLLAFSGISFLAPIAAHASGFTAPSIPTIPVQIAADNDFALLLGNEQGPTRVFYQNQDTWGMQTAAAATLNVTPEAGENYLYVVAMGGNAPQHPLPSFFTPGVGGFEGWGGTIDGIDVTQYPGATLAIDPNDPTNNYQDPNATCDPSNTDPSDTTNQQNCAFDLFGGQSTTVYKYLNIANSITGLRLHQNDCNTTADPNCDTVENGGFTDPSLLNDVQHGLSAVLSGRSTSDVWMPAVGNSNMFQPLDATPWVDNGAICSQSICTDPNVGRAWDFPAGQAILFRFPLSQHTPGVIPGNQQATLNVQNIDPTASGLRVNYRQHGTSTWSSQDFDLSQINPAHLVVGGLTNGLTYDFMVEVTDGTASSAPTTIGADSLIATAFLPDSPVITAVHVGIDQISVDFTPPADPSNSGIVQYDYSTDGSNTWAATATPAPGSPIIITGTSESNGTIRLTPGISHLITLRA